jgi:voltage-gated potassium channel
VIAATLLLSAAGTAVLLVAYYEAPLDRPLDAATG